MNISHFEKKRSNNEKITFVTCYDYTSATIVNASQIDGVLVGDSLAMTMYGHPTTLPASLQLMRLHTQAVAKAISKQFIVADLPFLSYRKSMACSMNAVQTLMQAGAHAVKLEGVAGNLATIRHIVESGVPVMGHIGLTPQSVHHLGGYRAQGMNKESAAQLVKQATTLEEVGCFALVLECMPAQLAKQITETLHIPTIGIGAGPHTSGQILVWHDLLGMQKDLSIKFVKQYMNGFEMMKQALNTYHQEVQSAVYPDPDVHCYKAKTESKSNT